tara:strand:- start:139 stop:291 length:153 start_codon:yes stop_codon:yes gene_type:complete
MKALKITLILAFLLTLFTSCTKQDLNDDDILVDPVTTIPAPGTGGGVDLD